MTMQTMHIGLDDTDSPRKGCTTYVAALLVERLQRLKVRFIDYPNLIRLNPNVPWKTRGNGALCLRIQYNENCKHELKDIVIEAVEEQADLECKDTDSGIVFLEREKIPEEISVFSKRAITGIVNLKEALKLLKMFEGEAVGFKKGRGIIGGLAAIGETLQGDHTFEILAYRSPENRGSIRKIEEASIIKMNEATSPYTFSNIDKETGRVLIAPRGPDPILLGIRGEEPESVKKAFKIVQPLETVERWVIFRTNQGTDAHLKRVRQLKDVAPNNPIIVTGTVAANPKIVPRRHVIFPIKDENAQIDCAAYEPTGTLRKAARKLISGDHVEIYGGVQESSKRHPLTVNLEKIRVLKTARKIVYRNPFCPDCGKRLKSMGKNKGLRCKRCRSRYTGIGKVEVELKREIRKDLYITSPRSQRHLTKPSGRYGLEKHRTGSDKLISNWHHP